MKQTEIRIREVDFRYKNIDGFTPSETVNFQVKREFTLEPREKFDAQNFIKKKSLNNMIFKA